MKKFELSRIEMKKFQQWLKDLPMEQTTFMRTTYERDEVREEKMVALYERYEKEKVL